MARGIRNSKTPYRRKKESAIGAWSLLREIEEFGEVGKLDVLFLEDSTEHFFLFLIIESLLETQTFLASSTNSLLNFTKLEHHILVWKAFNSTIDGDWKKKQSSTDKEASHFYHADPGCVQPRFPYFSNAYIQIPQEVENLLSESHKSHLKNMFSLSL